MKKRLLSLFLAVCVICSFASAVCASATVGGSPATSTDPDTIDPSVYADMFSPENPAHPYAPNPFEIQPNWSSTGISTHQFITNNAITIVKNAYPSYPLNTYSATLKVYSDYPDNSESGQTDNGSFSGHFYNPDTGLTWTDPLNPGIASPSYSANAQDRLIWWYNDAVSKYKSGKTVDAMHSLGCALHYTADLSEPHHASNQIALLSSHFTYETWAKNNQNNYITTSTSSSTFSWAKRTSIGDMGHNFAVNAKEWATEANIYSKFPIATQNTLPKAQRNCAAVLYKFLVDVGKLN